MKLELAVLKSKEHSFMINVVLLLIYLFIYLFIYLIYFCSYDYLRITNNNQTIGTYCGQRSGLNVRVTGNYAVITFRSDRSVQYRGYQLYFFYVPLGKHS